MSGGIKYRLNPIEINNLEAEFSVPPTWKKLLDSQGVQIRLWDPETTVEVEELDLGTRYTLVLPIDDDAKPENGRLYLHDRYLWDTKTDQLRARQRATDEQNRFFPQGPEWLTSHFNDYEFRGPGRYLYRFKKLKYDLSFFDPPTPFDPTEKEIGRHIRENFHRPFPADFFSAVAERRFLFEKIYPITQGARLTLRFTSSQSGYVIHREKDEIRIRLIIVIDDPEKSGRKSEQDGRIYLIEDLWFDSGDRTFKGHQRHWLNQGIITPRFKRVLEALTGLVNTPEQDHDEDVAWRELGEILLATETPLKSPTPSRKRMEPLLDHYAQDLLDQVESGLVSEPNQTQALAWRELLQLSLSGQTPSEETLEVLDKKFSLDPLHRETMEVWIALHRGQWNQARQKLRSTPSPSRFLRRLEDMLYDLEKKSPNPVDLGPYTKDTKTQELGRIFENAEPLLLEAVFDPSPVLAMGAASTVGGWTQLAMGRRLRHLKGGGYLASGLALALEAPTFVATSRNTTGIIPFSSQGTPGISWKQDLGTAYLIFGPLKAAGIFAQGLRGSLGNRIWWKQHPKVLEIATGGTAHSLGFLGLMGGHAAARSPALGWLPGSPDGPTTGLLQDALLYGHFLLGAGIAHQMFIRPLTGPLYFGAVKTKPPEAVARIEIETHDVSTQQISWLKSDRSVWTIGRAQAGEEAAHIQLTTPNPTSTISRRQGYFSRGRDGKLYYTDISRFGAQLSIQEATIILSPHESVPIEKGSILALGNDQEVVLRITPEDNLENFPLPETKLPVSWKQE